MDFRQGIVVAVHPQDHSVDLVMVDDGSRLIGVQVLTPNGSGRTGTFDMPTVPLREKGKWDITERTKQDQIAMVGFMRKIPFVVGFLFPQINQMTFGNAGRRFFRHQSDVTVSIEDTGAIHVRHPGGFQFRVGTPENVRAGNDKNTDDNFELTKNLEQKTEVEFSIGGRNGTTTKFSLFADKNGELGIYSKAKIKMWSKDRVEIKAPVIKLDADKVMVTGDVVTQAGVSLNNHVHGGIVRGGNKTDPSQGGGTAEGPTAGGWGWIVP